MSNKPPRVWLEESGQTYVVSWNSKPIHGIGYVRDDIAGESRFALETCDLNHDYAFIVGQPKPRCPWCLEKGLTKARARAEERERMIRLLMDGWSVCQTSLYDEEGVEGWRWTSPDGKEYCEIGAWNELPTLPDELKQ